MNPLVALSDALEALVARVSPAVVGVVPGRGQGSGTVLSPDGYILTNAHVVRGVKRPRVRLGEEEVRGALVGTDAATDLAVVKVETGKLQSLPLTPPERLKVGTLVVAIGHPFSLEHSVSLGVVSALDRMMPAPGGGALEGMIQTDAAINPGNSGGPLVNAHGEVVGINTIVLPYAQGIGFAVRAATASWVAGVLIHHGEVKRPLLGVTARAERLSSEHAERLGQVRGVRVLEVAPGEPADRGGVRAGDVLLRLEGERVASVDDLQRLMVLAKGPGLRLTVLRGNEERVLQVRPALRMAA
ncbi:MAG: trypsin-like peptidase domain-containing protein [Myxococcaceae bacterium]|nr:trypsin-like peptidase domain-containing protein [Myxococcaceae bacterium]MCI0673108.1 trypsin-like peptidase domain-containing protein [Myxococcaceae bacterium]